MTLTCGDEFVPRIPEPTAETVRQGKTEQELRHAAHEVTRLAHEDAQVFGCGPGESLPPDTVTEGARLPRKTREELVAEFAQMQGYTPEEVDQNIPRHDWGYWQLYHKRLTDLAGQIAGRTE